MAERENMKKIRVTVWNEYVHEREIPEIARVYPDGIHGCISEFLSKEENITVTTATLDMEYNGLSQEVLDNTDVLIWWGHCKHDDVSDETVKRVQTRVLSGMGLIALHSAHFSKIMKTLLGTSMNLQWRDNDSERLWCINPSHPIAKNVPECIVLPNEEMYGEPFDIPKPDDVIFLGWFEGGEVFRSGCTYTRGNGRIFYFQPGHEAYPIYYNDDIRRIIVNAVNWSYSGINSAIECKNRPLGIPRS